MLQLIISGLQIKFAINCTQPYLQKLYHALFLAAYYGLLRIGDIASSPHILLACNVHLGTNKEKLLFCLDSSKTHSKGDKLQIIKITSLQRRHDTGLKQLCPFNAISKYVNARLPSVSNDEQFFIFRDRTPVIPAHVCRTLQEVISV